MGLGMTRMRLAGAAVALATVMVGFGPVQANAVSSQPRSVPDTEPAPDTSKSCPKTRHGAVVDRARQRAWLCDNGRPLSEFAITSAKDQPDPGKYKVYSKSVKAYSYASGSYTTMTYFTAFARGEKTGARVGFHSVPKYRSGAYIQPLSSVGSMEMFGKTAGCVRVRPTQAVTIFRWLRIGDSVVVIS